MHQIETIRKEALMLRGFATEHGPGFVTAAVVDPFDNVLGIMYNQHYLDVLARG